jgi:hypothetical protein
MSPLKENKGAAALDKLGCIFEQRRVMARGMKEKASPPSLTHSSPPVKGKQAAAQEKLRVQAQGMISYPSN